MRIETDGISPASVYIMLNTCDIDRLIEKLQYLKSNPHTHFDIFYTGESKPVIDNLEISYSDDSDKNFDMDGSAPNDY